MNPPLPVDAIYARAFEQALAAAGGMVALARELGVPLDQLARWMDGRTSPPLGVFSQVLSIAKRPAAPALRSEDYATTVKLRALGR